MGDSDSWRIAGDGSDRLDTNTHTHRSAGGLIVAVWLRPLPRREAGLTFHLCLRPPLYWTLGAPRAVCFFLFFCMLFFFVCFYVAAVSLPTGGADHLNWTERSCRCRRQAGGFGTAPPTPCTDRRSLRGGGPGGFPSQLCLYYIVLTCRSLCLTHTPAPPPSIATWRKPCRCI